MDKRRRATVASAGIVCLFLVVQLGALALVEPFAAQGQQFVEDTSDPTNSVVYIGAILVATALMLAAFRLGVDVLVRGVVILSAAYVALFVFRVVVPPLLVITVSGVTVNALAWLAAAGLGGALYLYPEWYVIDGAGIVMAVGAAGIFGINFGILPALVLLSVLAVYDAISVYGTEHMLDLAEGVMDLRIPVLLVVPLSLSYSFLDADTPDASTDGGDSAGGDDAGWDGDTTGEAQAAEDDRADGLGDREALFIGLGDAVVPAVLVASAGFFVEGVPTVALPGLSVPLPAAAAMVGTVVGLVVLLRMVLAGRAHAGLPLLNGGAIAGYLLGALASGIPLAQALGLPL
jgi:presenilin-like A22 family membrane protease